MSVERSAPRTLIDEVSEFLESSATLLREVEEHLEFARVQPRFRAHHKRPRPGWRCQATVDSRLPAVRLTMHGVRSPQRYPDQSEAAFARSYNAVQAAYLGQISRSLARDFHIEGEFEPDVHDPASRRLTALLVYRLADLS